MIRPILLASSSAALLAVSACSAARSPASPSSSPAAPHEAHGDTTARGSNAADVRFLQGMIHHHAQALAMVALMPSRTSRQEMRLLGQRIAVSQRDEIATMRNWLARRGEYAPMIDSLGRHVHGDRSGHQMEGQGHDAGHHAMPGMLTEEEMSRLAAANGPAFDRLFLELMIRHHEGALAMVQQLFGTPGAAQDPELFGIASEVDADQRAEIERMRALLETM